MYQRNALVFLILCFGTLIRAGHCSAQQPNTVETDSRDGALRNLNGYFPFKTVSNLSEWEQRRYEIRRRILVSQGLWPLPTRTQLNPVIHGRIERDDYVVDRVFFESVPGHFVTGSLYRPKGRSGPFPVVLSPHGHWKNGRFYDAGEKQIEQDIQSGAEHDEVGGRFPIQARAVQLARMGCMVFVYDMTGNADSVQIEHRPAKWSHLDRSEDWGFMSVQADLRLQNMMGLQTWNSIRAVDFLCGLEEVDEKRIGITGASGGGTQTMILSAIDNRLAASMPCVMVSTAMQGGCTCENAPFLRIDQGNVDIAAVFAPKPLALTAADDWTVELQRKGYPDLLALYEMLGEPANLTGVFRTEFKHNYNLVNRTAMYHFFNHHFKLGFEEPIRERYYEPLILEEATVWSGSHSAPKGGLVGDDHEVRLLQLATEDSENQMQQIAQSASPTDERFRRVIGGGWQTILGRTLSEVGEVTESFNTNASNADQITLTRKLNRENVLIQKWFDTDKNQGLVILVSDNGLHDLSNGTDSLPSQIQDRLLAQNIGVIGCDLYGQHSPASEAQPMWYQPNGDQGWKRFSGYTYGYNHPLFVKRVHDLLTVIQYAQQLADGPIHLVGIGATAGPIAAAARSQAESAITKLAVDASGFQFEQLTSHSDPMFVPGSVKYLGLDGLLALSAPQSVALMKRNDQVFPTTKQIYRQLDSLETFEQYDQMIEYLLRNPQ